MSCQCALVLVTSFLPFVLIRFLTGGWWWLVIWPTMHTLNDRMTNYVYVLFVWGWILCKTLSIVENASTQIISNDRNGPRSEFIRTVFILDDGWWVMGDDDVNSMSYILMTMPFDWWSNQQTRTWCTRMENCTHKLSINARTHAHAWACCGACWLRRRRSQLLRSRIITLSIHMLLRSIQWIRYVHAVDSGWGRERVRVSMCDGKQRVPYPWYFTYDTGGGIIGWSKHMEIVIRSNVYV